MGGRRCFRRLRRSLQSFKADASNVSLTRTVLRLAGCHGVVCATMASTTSPGSAPVLGLWQRPRRRRVPTYHGSFARGSHLASQHTPRGSSLSSEGAAPRAVWGARGRRGWRRRRTRPMMDIGTGVPANHDESTTPPAVAPCFSEPDPLALALGLEPCTSTVPPTWFDPMLEELDASQVVCHAAGVPALGCPLFQEV